MNDEDLNQSLSRKLKRLNEPLPPGVQGRLRAARRTALQAPAQKRPSKFLLTAMSLACVATVAVIGLQEHQPPSSTAPVDDMVMLTSGDDIELYEDLEFMLWLGEQSDAELERSDV